MSMNTHMHGYHTHLKRKEILDISFLFHYGQFLAQVKGFQLDTVENELM